MLKGFISSLTLAATLFAATQAEARLERITLDMWDQTFMGSSTVHLKQLINQRPGTPNLQNARIVQVSVLAKSYVAYSYPYGQAYSPGTIALRVGSRQTYPSTIAGNMMDFNSYAGHTFFWSSYLSPAQIMQDNQGVWQLDVQGNVKIRQILVDVDVPGPVMPPPPPYYPPQPQPIPPYYPPQPVPQPVPVPVPPPVNVCQTYNQVTFGAYESDRGGAGMTVDIGTIANNLKTITIRSSKGTTRIQKVLAERKDGSVQDLTTRFITQNGSNRLEEDQQVTICLANQINDVKKLTVTTSGGNAARFRVLLGY